MTIFVFFRENRDYDFLKNRILIMMKFINSYYHLNKIETINASDQNSNIPFLRYEFSKIFGNFSR